MQQNSKCRICNERDEMINYRISNSSKLAQKEYKNRHNEVRKTIHWKLCKRLKFDHTAKWYMHKPESVLENEIHKILWDFKIQTDHSILARGPDLVLINKKRTYHLMDFTVQHTIERKQKRVKRQILGPCQRVEKAVEHESDSDTNWSWCTQNSSQRLGKEIRETGNHRKNQDHTDNSTVKISKNTQKSPGHLRRLAVIQTPGKYHHLELI